MRAHFNSIGRLRGQPDTLSAPVIGIEPGSEVAIQPSHALNEYILGESPDWLFIV